MPRQYSLKLRKDFKRLYKHGIRKHSKNFQLIFVDSDALKIGFLVKKDDIKLSSHRIYSKRIAREIVRKNLLSDLISKKMHIGVSVKTNLKILRKSVKYSELERELLELFKLINFNAPAFKKDKERTFHDRRPNATSPKNTRN